MITYTTIELEITGSIANLKLNRSDKHNALNELMIDELTHAAIQLKSDSNVRVIILSANGKSFCAGGDLDWMRSQADNDRVEKITQSSKLATMLRELDEMPKPVIGVVQGAAYGGGVGLICVCDIVIACESAKFALTETRLGLIPATIGPYVVRRLGEGHARQIFIHGKAFSSEKALALGLVSEVVSADQLDQVVRDHVNACLNCAPGAMAQAKQLCLTLAREQLDDPLEFTANKLADRWESEEAQEGISAFFNKRKPSWNKNDNS